MRPERDDLAYLQDMLEAANDAADFVRGRSFEDYLANTMLRAAVERKVEIIGEACRHVSREFKSQHPEIPWKPIETQRHRLIHEYMGIEHRRIWDVATVHVPPLVQRLEAILRRGTPQPPSA